MPTKSPHSVDQSSAKRASWESALLARLRKSVDGLTYSKLAEMTSVHPETVRRYLTRGRPSAFFIAAISRALHLPPDWILHGADDRRGKGSSAVEAKPAGTARARRSPIAE